MSNNVEEITKTGTGKGSAVNALVLPEWSREEKLWLSRAKRLFRERPEAMLFYSTDDDIIVCKRGTSSLDLSESLPGSEINCGCVITDMHDDMGRGA